MTAAPGAPAPPFAPSQASQPARLCEIPCSARAVFGSEPWVARSPSETMPTRRLSRFSTGRRPTWSGHVLGHMLDVLILEAVFDLVAHDVADLGIGSFSFCDAA